MLKIFVGLFSLVFWSCGHGATQSIPVAPPVNVNKSAPLPSPTPTISTELSDCSRKRAVGLAAGVNIPQELCLDETKPVDAKEKSNAKVGNSPQSASVEAENISFDKLPAEVRKIVRLTAPDMDTSAVVFDLTIIPTPDERAGNRLVKSYSYNSASKTKAAGKDPNHHNWLFKRQNNLLKLDYAEIDTTK